MSAVISPEWGRQHACLTPRDMPTENVQHGTLATCKVCGRWWKADTNWSDYGLVWRTPNRRDRKRIRAYLATTEAS